MTSNWARLCTVGQLVRKFGNVPLRLSAEVECVALVVGGGAPGFALSSTFSDGDYVVIVVVCYVDY